VAWTCKMRNRKWLWVLRAWAVSAFKTYVWNDNCLTYDTVLFHQESYFGQGTVAFFMLTQLPSKTSPRAAKRLVFTRHSYHWTDGFMSRHRF
jgi:hypothetical protein